MAAARIIHIAGVAGLVVALAGCAGPGGSGGPDGIKPNVKSAEPAPSRQSNSNTNRGAVASTGSDISQLLRLPAATTSADLGQIQLIKSLNDSYLARIDRGEIHGVTKGMHYVVVRGREVLGDLVIGFVGEDRSAGVLRLQPSGIRPRPGDQVRRIDHQFLVQINQGKLSGVRQGMHFTVHREGKLIGDLQIYIVNLKSAMGVLTPRGPSIIPMPGDQFRRSSSQQF